MSPRIEDVPCSDGACPEAMVEAFGEAALTVAALLGAPGKGGGGAAGPSREAAPNP